MKESAMSKIVIIDDDMTSVVGIRRMLESFGYQVDVFTDPKKGLQEVMRQPPDLILLDVVMPNISGLDVLQVVRTKYAPLELPILMLSIRPDAEFIIDAFKRGANDYILKHEKIEISHARIKNHIDLIKLSRENARLKEYETLSALVATYNHEVNNPLTVAKLALSNLGETNGDAYQTLEKSLDRIAEVMGKIKNLQSQNVEYGAYIKAGAKLVKLQG